MAGFCVIGEVGDKLCNSFGKKNVNLSHDCTNFVEAIKALSKLSGVTITDLISNIF